MRLSKLYQTTAALLAVSCLLLSASIGLADYTDRDLTVKVVGSNTGTDFAHFSV